MDDSKPDQSADKGETENELREDTDVNAPVRDVKGPKVFGRVKEEFEAIVEAIHRRKEEKNQGSPSSVESPRHYKETHGRSEDIDVDTPIGDFKGPNIFHRAKEEIEAIVDTVHSKRESSRDAAGASPKKLSSFPDRWGSPRHHKETHGRSEDFDADTPIGDFKGPNIFHRAKEEIEAIVDTVHSKRESNRDAAASPKKQTALLDRRGSPRHYKETHGRSEDMDADTPVSEYKGPNFFHRAKEEIEAIVDTVHSKRESNRDATSPKKDGFRASISKKLQKPRSSRD